MSDKDIIEAGEWAICRLCEDVFRRKRETRRYCSVCCQGFCDGEHGSFAYGRGTCVVCGVHRDYKTRQKVASDALPGDS